MGKHKLETFCDNYFYTTKKEWVFLLDDDKPRQFGVWFEVVDMYEATGEKEFKNYPFIVSASLVADKVHKSFNESESKKPDKLSLIYDAMSYMGGVPVDHILQNAIKNSSEKESPFDSLASKFTTKEATIISEKQDFGTFAAQNGKGSEHQYLQFKTQEAAEKFINLLLDRTSALVMIGFILDRPINMMGETGWSVMEKQVKGVK